MSTPDDAAKVDPGSADTAGPGGLADLAEAAPADDASDAEAPADDRQKFREALDRKHAGHAAAAGGGHGSTSGPHPHTGPAKTQRTFRRKSG